MKRRKVPFSRGMNQWSVFALWCRIKSKKSTRLFMAWRHLGTVGIYRCSQISADPGLESVHFATFVEGLDVPDLVVTFLVKYISNHPVPAVVHTIVFADGVPALPAGVLVACSWAAQCEGCFYSRVLKLETICLLDFGSCFLRSRHDVVTV